MRKFTCLVAVLATVALAISACTPAQNPEPQDEKKQPSYAGFIVGPTLLEDGRAITLAVAEIEGAATYQWYKDGEKIQNTDSKTLSVTAVGTYSVAGANEFGEGRPSPDHIVSLDPSSTIPAAAGAISGPNMIDEGNTETLRVDEIAGAETYQWYKYGEKVQNTAERTLRITDGGVYKVAGVNKHGEGAPSPEFTVTFFPAGPLFVNELAGTWDVTEWVYNPGARSWMKSDHEVVVTKVDDGHVDISGFCDIGENSGERVYGDITGAVVNNVLKTFSIPLRYKLAGWPTDNRDGHLVSPNATSLDAYSLYSNNFTITSLAPYTDAGKQKLVLRAAAINDPFTFVETEHNFPAELAGTHPVAAYAIVEAMSGTPLSVPYVFANTVWTKQ